ncbi:hypothetical protein A2641_00010 [Candidatus Nomurabacteria bacterium RIFCSPHIGHO2_01_FULL_37_25]|uniref:SGNH hydrolase-type esterase domain-containing protein n=1 Tax=Candidatus Nomurabacteria bacterium RIFCSPLOWO2_01_FULL_36_16 TaxID=1801767 RepID=A0A1F6WYJ1_9BACT|nr:MAG: hypothetical protein A2641_00010 [Candidatus Nomurabacteria bacterium RIFCSPHIGHO2_01_FULL_37_25]OGI75199.1 MAG: hypothetical protein A3D36_03685 [Candidatus Nomurabacteria bacterium RIFCSPHIGHO2_02_FULL_36_29]OGI86844.1 MAG: hypothetical protein A3A91_03140 [Candidatus Nomurabacteria bacterium RIFCSPLOWO2_01_FULL_36_16]
MKKIITIVFVVILVTGTLFFIFKKSPKITNYPGKGKTIIAFGDSLVKGNGATTGNDFSSVLSRLLGVPIINMGIPGNTSADGLSRLESVNIEDPKIVMILFGGNDFLQKVKVEETFKNLDDIVVKIQNSGAVVILLGIKGGLLSDQYNEYFEDIAQNRGTFYVPNVLSGLIGHSEYMSDAIHPNDAGYKKIAEKIYPVLQKALK